MSEINVTPLVDVMLVLLVIFMITAPAMKEGFQVELPQATSTQSVMVQDVRMITVTADGNVRRPLAASPDVKYEKLSLLVEDLKPGKEEGSRATASGPRPPLQTTKTRSCPSWSTTSRPTRRSAPATPPLPPWSSTATAR